MQKIQKVANYHPRQKPSNEQANRLRYKFDAWLSEKPRAKRQYKTQRAWAKAHGVREETVSRWKRKPLQPVTPATRRAELRKLQETLERLRKLGFKLF